MLLFRLLIAIVLIALFLPIGRDPQPHQADDTSELSALAAAGAALSDVRSFCERQPQTCAIGGRALQSVGEQARTGAQTIQALIAEQVEAEPAQAPTVVKTPAPEKTSLFSLTDMLGRLASANIAVPRAEPESPPRQSSSVPEDTLLPTDKQPAWQKPNIKPSSG